MLAGPGEFEYAGAGVMLVCGFEENSNPVPSCIISQNRLASCAVSSLVSSLGRPLERFLLRSPSFSSGEALERFRLGASSGGDWAGSTMADEF